MKQAYTARMPESVRVVRHAASSLSKQNLAQNGEFSAISVTRDYCPKKCSTPADKSLSKLSYA